MALSAALLFATKVESFANFVVATPLPGVAHGSLWLVPEVDNAICVGASFECGVVPMGSVPTTAADVTFSTSIINFSSFGTATNTVDLLAGDQFRDYTIGSFLNSLGAVPLASQFYSPVASPLVGFKATPDTSLINNCIPGAPCGLDLYGTFIEITGDLLLATGDHIKIAHDDGVTLAINGTLVPGFTSPLSTDHPESFTYLGASGLVGFDLTYAESATPPAFLELAVPEPGTLALFGSSLLGLGWLARRRRT